MAIQQNIRDPLGYVTKQDLENFLLTDIDSSFDDQIDNWIVAAEDQVNRFLGYTTASGIWNEAVVEEVSETAIVDSNNDLVIYPRKRPINTVERIDLVKGTSYLTLNLSNGTRVNSVGDTVTNYRYHLPEPSNKIIYPEAELSTNGGTLAIGGFSSLKYSRFLSRITYHAGYTEIPGPINMATAMLASDLILRQDNKNGLQLITQGRITKEWFQRKGGESDLALDAEKLLLPYRITSRWMLS